MRSTPSNRSGARRLVRVPGLAAAGRNAGGKETIERYQRLTGCRVRNLRFNEMLPALALACPVSKLQARFRDPGLLTDDVDLVGFCAERIRQLLD